MRRRLQAVSGSVQYVAMSEGLPAYFDPPARSVSFVGDSFALVVGQAEPGGANLIVIGASGEEIQRLGTTCGTGFIDQILDVRGEIRAIEVTPSGDFQARLDLHAMTLTRLAEWR